jgi:hypothetical protein
MAELPDGRWDLKIVSQEIRTNTQNAYYWTILEEYIQPGLYNQGYRSIKSKDDAHEFCRARYLRHPVVNEISGEIGGYITLSTSELTKKEFGEYLDEVIQMASEYLGIVIPEPNKALPI